MSDVLIFIIELLKSLENKQKYVNNPYKNKNIVLDIYFNKINRITCKRNNIISNINTLFEEFVIKNNPYENINIDEINNELDHYLNSIDDNTEKKKLYFISANVDKLEFILDKNKIYYTDQLNKKIFEIRMEIIRLINL